MRKHVPWILCLAVLIGYLHYHLVYALVLSAIVCQVSIDPCTVAPLKDLLVSILWSPLSKLPGTPIAEFFGYGSGIEADEFELALDSAIWAIGFASVLWALLRRFKRSTRGSEDIR